MSDSARLILVHGTRMNAQQWRPYRALLDGLDVVALDLPGHGERVQEVFSTQAAVATIAGEVGRAAPGQPVVLAGHSLGGYMASVYAAQHPGELDALVLLGATADPNGPLTGIYRGFAKALPYLGPERLARGMNAVMRGLGARGEHAEVLPDGAAYAALPLAWQAVIDECTPELLREVAAPVWLVNGQLDQMRLHVRRYAAVCQDPHVVTIRRATHLMPATHPVQVAHVLREVATRASRRPPARS